MKSLTIGIQAKRIGGSSPTGVPLYRRRPVRMITWRPKERPQLWQQPAASSPAGAEPTRSVTVEELSRVLAAPVLKLEPLDRPVMVASMELLRNGRTFLLRTRSADGAEAITVPHPAKMADVYPFFLKSVV